MKMFKSSLLAAMLLVLACGFSKADTKNKIAKTADDALNHYIEVVSQGKVAQIEQLFDEQFTYSISNQGKVKAHNRKDLIDYLKEGKYIVQDCITSYELIEQTDDYSLARVEMKYDNFTKVDYVTLSRGIDGWKVSQVTSTYPKK